jgi:hypothetical protein
VSGLVFVLFLGLGILALLGGAILGGVFDEGPTAETSPSPIASVTETEEPLPEPTPAPTPGPSVAPTSTPSSSGPIEFPDGFIARAEPCGEEPSGPTCDNSGAVNDGEVWVLVSFRHAKPTDVIGVSVIDAGGDVDGEKSLELNFCGESTDCAGWTFFGFDNLAPGGYTVRATRNGDLAATTSFTVE